MVHVRRYHETEESCMFFNFRGSQMDLINHLSDNCEIDKEQRVSEPEENCKECDYVLDTNDDLRTHVEDYRVKAFQEEHWRGPHRGSCGDLSLLQVGAHTYPLQYCELVKMISVLISYLELKFFLFESLSPNMFSLQMDSATVFPYFKVTVSFAISNPGHASLR